MVWTAIVKCHQRDKVKSVIFESSHDSNLAYKELVSRAKDNHILNISEIVVLIPGKHTFMYFPSHEEKNV
jgi:hypothetical protein